MVTPDRAASGGKKQSWKDVSGIPGTTGGRWFPVLSEDVQRGKCSRIKLGRWIRASS